ncbi:hypothetical protein HAX54_049910 [Datura stramonium]|uniref:Polygalacturonase n=1 Tax=Datura stramonium TaxID=4076 RepID=A0ABS8WN27_DATST|nr:hypothetical protein [Datura stramonium]
MAIPKGLEINNVGFVLLLVIAILSSKVAECATFGSRRGLMETVFDVTNYGAIPNTPADSTRSLVFQTVKSSSINNINFVDSKGVHLKITDSNDISISNIKITAPGTSPNTDGVHISETTNVNVTDSNIDTGDDCISIGHGTSNVYISNINCGPGHGISVGSLGKRLDEKDVKGVVVRNCTFHGTSNGARIKTYMGSPSLQVSDVVYEDIVLDDVRNPIFIDQHYHSKDKNEPSKVKLVDIHFKNIRGTTSTKAPVALNCSEAIPCEGVELVDIDLAPFGAIGPLLPATCQNAKTILGGKNNPPAC